MTRTVIDPKKPRRHRLTKMVYDEISFVDRGANQHANVMIVKRDVSKMIPADQGGSGGKSSSKPAARKADWYAADRAPTKSGSGKGAKSERAQHWKEGKHPRNAAGSGSPRGGTFKQTSAASKKKYGKGGTTKAKLNAKKKSSGKTTTKTVTYRMKAGDTLWDLAKKYYGDPQQWKKIAKASGIKDPRKIPVGAKITIPGVKVKAAAKKAKASRSASPGEHRVMEPGGRVHWEKNKAVHQRSSTKTTKTKAEIAAQKREAAKRKAERLKRQRDAKKKLAIKKRVTGVEKIAAQVMFDEYLGRR